MHNPALRPSRSRAQDTDLVAQCRFGALRHRLPLSWPAPADVPPSPKKAYRSAYTYPGWQDLDDPQKWEHLDDFDLLLRLIDFSPLRDVLAQRLGWSTARGHRPFDPVSIFLLIGWQLFNGWNRATVLRKLRDPRYADYARHFGFKAGVFPTEGGLRHWLTALGRHSQNGDTVAVQVNEEEWAEVAVEYLNQLIAQSVHLLRANGFLSPQAWDEALICPDGMIHDAASAPNCGSVTATCYQPSSPDHPRPCPAKEQGLPGCDGDTRACASACRRATPRDPEARFIRYRYSNRSDAANQNGEARGEPRYGYASLPLLLADPLRRFHLILADHFSPANARQEVPFAAQLLQLSSLYPSLHVRDVAADAAFGYFSVLNVVYHHLHARRLIDLRAHETDHDKSLWPLRGYDDKGRPVCPFGYPFTSNGFDFAKHRHKWFCEHACQKGVKPLVTIPDLPLPISDCPHLHSGHGRILNVGFAFQSDGSWRLVRDVAVASTTWKQLYHRARNASESRNATFERRNLKRSPVYGQLRSKALTFLADVWFNLTTLARLVREASAVTGA